MRNRLYLVAVGVFLAVLVMGFLAFFNSRSIVLSQIDQGGTVAAQSAADTIRNWLESRRTLVEDIGSSAGYVWENYGIAGQLLRPYFESVAQKYKGIGFMDVFMALPSGDFIDGTGWKPPSGWDPRTRAWYKAAAESDRPILTTPYVDANTGDLIVTVAIAVKGAKSGGDLLGVVGADLSLKDLTKIVGDQRILGVGFGALIGSDGQILVHPDKNIAMKENITKASAQIPPALAEAGTRIIRGESGVVTFEKNGRTLMLFYRPLGWGWSLALTVPQDELLAPIGALGMRQLLVGAAAVLLMGLLILSMVRGLMVPVDRLLHVSSAVDRGDLTQSAGLTGTDELSRLGKALDGMVTGQRELLTRFRDEGESMGTQARRLDDLAGKTEGVLSSVRDQSRDLARTAEENARAVESMTAGIQEVASSAQGAAQAASEASAYAESLKSNAEGASEVIGTTSDRVGEMAGAFRQVSGAVSRLNDQASQIGSIVSTISGIADQTNLLALNAAIEAARAGEAGRGFAVVAEEVRKLAEESNQAARGIGDLARDILSGTGVAVAAGESGVRLAEAVEGETRIMRDRIAQVLGAIGQIVDQIQSVAATSQEQSAGAQEMAASVDRIARGTDEARRRSEGIATSVGGLAESARLLAEASGQLDGFVRSFQELLRKYRLEEGTAPMLPVRG
jgi:methyl-accepting chemotaxis protein